MPTTKFLTEAGAKKLIELLIAQMDNQLADQIVTTIDDTSADEKVPSAKSVYEFVLDKIADFAHFGFEVIEWEDPAPVLPATGESHIIYLKQETQTGPWIMWYYFGNAWVQLGTTSIDLIDYWKKEELVALTNDEIQAIFDEVLGITP